MNSFFSIFHLYGLLIGIASVVGLWLVDRMTRFFDKKPWLESALPYMALGAIVGARLYHLLTDWQLYAGASFFDLIAVWHGGLGFLGALIGGILGLLVWVHTNHGSRTTSNPKFSTFNFQLSTRIFTYLDLLSFGIPLAQTIGRLGNYVNQELYGLPTNFPWGIMISGNKYHPLFLYEAVCNILLFVFLLWMARGKRLVLGKGQYACVYLFGYAFIRFWLEYLRAETARFEGRLGFISVAQWATLFIMIMSASIFWVRRHWPQKQFDFSLN